MQDSEETRKFWNRVAADWDIQVGEEGDQNRRLNSDPVLLDFAGDVEGQSVLDAGCGTGYLARKLRDRGAHVVGIDFSEEMIGIARTKDPTMDLRVDSCSTLATVPNASMDLLVSNYMLMDTPDLEGTVRAFHRVLKPGGIAVLVFSHPCFPQGSSFRSEGEDGSMLYRWKVSYFECGKRVDPPWNHFTSKFIWFHRPLSDYWKAFLAAGFDVVEFEEPRVTEDRHPLAKNARELFDSQTRPYSVIFKLRKGD